MNSTVQDPDGRQPAIDIILSTYNGGKFLRAQLDSLLAQTEQDWRLLIRDDGSTDDTVEIIREYAQRHGRRIRLVEAGAGNLGASQSFSRLLAHADADYIMLCDQDDVWFPDKIERTLARMRRLEGAQGPASPSLVFSDVSVVDEHLRVIDPSGWHRQNSDPGTATRLSRLLLMSPANGCTMLLNRSLLRLAVPIPPAALMHDYWLLLVAAALGQVAYLPEPTLYYRQHGRNELGSKRWGQSHILAVLSNLSAARQAIQRHRWQAAALYERYGDMLGEADRQALTAYMHLPERGFWRKRREILRHGFFYVGAVRNIGWFILV